MTTRTDIELVAPPTDRKNDTVAHIVVPGIELEKGQSCKFKVSPYDPRLGVGISRPQMLAPGYGLKGLFLLQANTSNGSALITGDWKDQGANPECCIKGTSMTMDIVSNGDRFSVYYSQETANGKTVLLGRAFDVGPTWGGEDVSPTIIVVKYPVEMAGELISVDVRKGEGVANERQKGCGIGGTYKVQLPNGEYVLKLIVEGETLRISASIGNVINLALPFVDGKINGTEHPGAMTKMRVPPQLVEDMNSFLKGLIGEVTTSTLGSHKIILVQDVKTHVVD